jgi:hypothetical protein
VTDSVIDNLAIAAIEHVSVVSVSQPCCYTIFEVERSNAKIFYYKQQMGPEQVWEYGLEVGIQ